VMGAATAFMAMMQVDSLAQKAITVSRRMRRLTDTFPIKSRPTRLQLFLPRSIPSIAIFMASFLMNDTRQSSSALSVGAAIHKGESNSR